MLLKVALVVALGSLGLIAVRRLVGAEDAAQLERTVEAQLQALRDHLFRR